MRPRRPPALVELTELEARLIEQADVDGMTRVYDERADAVAALLAALPPAPADGGAVPGELAAANERAASAAADVIRQRPRAHRVAAAAVTPTRAGPSPTPAPRMAGPGGLAVANAINFTGLASGVDTNSIVDQLMRSSGRP